MSRPTVIYSLPRVPSVNSCVYRISFNDKFVIVKAKDHIMSIQAIQKSLNQFMRNSELQRNPTNLYYHFFSYVEKVKDGYFTVEILLESDNAYELLKAEQKALNEAIKDKKCLNNNVEAYIPDFNEITGMYGWLPKTSVMSFKKWKKSL